MQEQETTKRNCYPFIWTFYNQEWVEVIFLKSQSKILSN